jgi:dihydrofolate reductase
MRKIMVFNYVSLDGFFAGPLGEIDWFKSIKSDEEFERITHEEAGTGEGTVLFGRKTYDMMKSYWPTSEAIRTDPMMAKVVNQSEKIVFSRRLDGVEEGPNWKNVSLMREITKESITKLKKKKGKDMVIIGSGSIVKQLTEMGMVDEYQLMVVPVVLGMGKNFFTNVQQMDLRLVSAKGFKNGVVQLKYRPA